MRTLQAGILGVGLCVLLCAPSIVAAESDSSRTDTMSVTLDHTTVVIGKRVSRGSTEFPFERERFQQALQSNGFGLITKGVFLAQDVYAEGFKRDDISIVIDGERYHSACPNRMDSPLARSNPLEMAAIDLEKTSSNIQSGLGGSIEYHREPLQLPVNIRGGASQALGRYESSDVAFSATAQSHRIAGQYATGTGYDDGDGKSFVDRYGYREDNRYMLADVAVSGERKDWTYRGALTYTENVMFPYLAMDERVNRVFSGYLGYLDHKLYFNYTDHLMDNGLRTDMGSMTTDATNLTIGANSEFYDVYYRHWNADNQIVTPMTSISNHLMPDVGLLAASVFQRRNYNGIEYWGRVGVAYHTFDDARTSFYEAVHGDISADKAYVTWSAGGGYDLMALDRLHVRLVGDLVSEPPATQSMYIAVQRPPGKPWWSGNPNLSAPIRASVRTELGINRLSAELSISHVWNYVDLTAAMAGGQAYMTYENVDALMASVNVNGSWRYIDARAGYTWAASYPGEHPLAEVPPLYAAYRLKSPVYRGAQAWFGHEYNDAQTRVDASLQEMTTGAWNRFDVGLAYSVQDVRIGLEVNNLFDELYSRHLSYLRNPYSTGTRVYEPGRTVRLNVVFNAD